MVTSAALKDLAWEILCDFRRHVKAAEGTKRTELKDRLRLIDTSTHQIISYTFPHEFYGEEYARTPSPS